uniref:Uncharacterized protein n=1 Tax=Rodentolepis nana TaxID=102285 RepID=A0A0R3T6E7_RODNA
MPPRPRIKPTPLPTPEGFDVEVGVLLLLSSEWMVMMEGGRSKVT